MIEVAKGATTADLSPMSGDEALQRMEEAEACGLAVTCTDAEGKWVSKDQLRQAAGRIGQANILQAAGRFFGPARIQLRRVARGHSPGVEGVRHEEAGAEETPGDLGGP